jgi:hypothetical protein
LKKRLTGWFSPIGAPFAATISSSFAIFLLPGMRRKRQNPPKQVQILHFARHSSPACPEVPVRMMADRLQ